MSLSYNTGGLITRGFGDDQRIVTRGFGKNVDYDAGFPIQKTKEYFLDLFAPILKQNVSAVNILVPILVEKNDVLKVNSPILKEVINMKSVFVEVDSTKMFEALDEI